MSVVMSQIDSKKNPTDVKPLQKTHDLCLDCKSNPIPLCQICEMMRMTKEENPFTKEQVDQLYREMKLWFYSSKKGIIQLTVLQNSMLIGRIDWRMHNCAFSVLVLMLSSSNAALNSINQQIFAGYILAVIINAIQETGSCDPIVLEVFRLELTNLSGNPVWSNWSELVEFHQLYNICVENNIIIANEVVFVPSNDDGSYVKQALDRKHRSTLVGAYKWVPSIHDLANGTLSADLSSKHRLRAVVLIEKEHFSIIDLNQGFWLIDGKGERIDDFKAKSKLLELTFGQFQELCATTGAFYLFEEVPFVTERQAIPPQPPAPCAQGHWGTPPAFPPPQFLPPPSPIHAPCVNVKENSSDNRFLPFSFEYGTFKTTNRDFKKFWSYRYEVTSKIIFIKSGECVEQNGIYTEYKLDGKIFIFTTLKIQIQTEYNQFIKDCE